MNPLTAAFRQMIAGARKRPALLIALFFIQLLFLSAFGFINVRYQLAIAENLQNIVTPLQDANYDEQAITSGLPFLNDAEAIFGNYEQLIRNLWKLVVFSLLAFLLINLWGWALTHAFFEKQNVPKLMLALLVRALAFVIPLLAINYALITLALRQAAASGALPSFGLVYAAGIITFAGVYFLLVSLALPAAPSFTMHSLTGSLKQALAVGVKKAHYLLAALLVNIASIAGAAYLLGKAAADWPFLVLALAVVFFVKVFMLARVWWVGVVRGVSNQ